MRIYVRGLAVVTTEVEVNEEEFKKLTTFNEQKSYLFENCPELEDYDGILETGYVL